MRHNIISVLIVLFSSFAFCLCVVEPNCTVTPPIPADLTNPSGKLSISGGIDDLSGKSAVCIWRISSNGTKANYTTHLFINHFEIGDNDNLTITVGNDDVFVLNGTKTDGFVLTGSTDINVTLRLSNAKTDRNFDVRYSYQSNAEQIQNIDRPGRIAIYTAKKGDKQSLQLTLGVHNQLPDRNLLLNCEAFNFNTSGSVSFENATNIDNKPYDKQNSPPYILSKGSSIKLKFIDIPLDGKSPFILHYELVNSICSSYAKLDFIKKGGRNINLPNNTQLQTLDRYKCFNLFELNDKTGKFQFNFNDFTFINSYDKLTVSDGDYRNSSTIALVIPEYYKFFKTLPLFSTSNKIAIVYECPQVVNTSTTSYTTGLTVSTIKLGGRITDGQLNVKKGSDADLPLTFTFETDDDKQAVLFIKEDNKVLPGIANQTYMFVSNALSTNRSPFADLKSATYPPSFIASDTNELRIEINSTEGDFNAELRSYAKGCFGTAYGDSASYTLTSCADVCEWYIPTNGRNGTFVLQFSHFNLSASDNISIEKFYTTKETVFEMKGPYTTLAFPDLNLDASYYYAVYTKRNCNASNVSGIFGLSMAYVKQDLDRHLINLNKYETQSIRPMNYPYYYTIGTNHEWALYANPNLQILLTFTDLNIATNHMLNVKIDSKTTISLNRTSPLPSDYLVNSPVILTLLSQSFDASQQPYSGRGFNLSATAVDCGGTVTVDGSKSESITANTNASECIWIVNAAQEDKKFNVLNFTKDYKNDSSLRIYDSNSLRDVNHILNSEYFNTTYSLSSSRSIVIVYTSRDKKPLTNLSITFSITNCYTIANASLCANNVRCFLPQFKCNGVNDCGDWTDELYCNSTAPPPTPPPEPQIIKSGGVNGWVVVFVICPLCIGLGVALTIFGPPLMQRFRRGRYTEFQDFSEVS